MSSINWKTEQIDCTTAKGHSSDGFNISCTFSHLFRDYVTYFDPFMTWVSESTQRSCARGGRKQRQLRYLIALILRRWITLPKTNESSLQTIHHIHPFSEAMFVSGSVTCLMDADLLRSTPNSKSSQKIHSQLWMFHLWFCYRF